MTDIKAQIPATGAGNTLYTQIRCVQYPCIIGGRAVDRVGLFEVDMDKNNLPIRATMLRHVGYENPSELIDFFNQVERAIFEASTLILTNEPVDLDNDEWSGTLYFPRLPTLR